MPRLDTRPGAASNRHQRLLRCFRPRTPGRREDTDTGGETGVLLLIVLALLAIIAFGVGFTVHWLFIVAIVLTLIWLISILAGGVGGRSRGAWF
jgi:hypothetical protein